MFLKLNRLYEITGGFCGILVTISIVIIAITNIILCLKG